MVGAYVFIYIYIIIYIYVCVCVNKYMVVISQDIPAKIIHRLQLDDCTPELLAPVTCESPIASAGGFLPQFDGKRMEKSKTRPAAFPWVSHEPSHLNQSFGKEESFLN